MSPEAPFLSIIIVNYNTGRLISECLQSVMGHNDGANWEFIVVDNSGNPADKELVLSQFPRVQWIEMGYNAGFARANNRGIRQATANLVLLLNPDTLALDDSITTCATRLNESVHSAAGIQLLDAGKTPQISGSYFVKGGLNHLLPIPYWGQLVRWAAYKAKTTVPGIQQAKAEQRVDWISGAFLMVKREAFNKSGLMDEDFFLYGEEVEWCYRLGKTGTLALYGDLRIIHLEGVSINQSQNLQEQGYYNLYDRKGLQLMVSNHLRVRKQYGVGWFLFLLLNYSWGALFYFIASLLQFISKPARLSSAWKRARAFAANVIRLWGYAPTIIGNKPHFYKMF